MLHEALTGSIIGAFHEVNDTLGHGLLENLYLAALERELAARGHRVVRELSVRVMYKGEQVGCQRLDMVIDDLVIVEAKSSVRIAEIARRQLYNYLRCTCFEVGLLLHFSPTPTFYREICENRLKSPVVASVGSVPSV